MRTKERAEEINFASWVSGIYGSYSLASVFGEGNHYPQEPLLLFEEDEEKSMKKQDNDAKIFGAYAAMFNKSFNNEKIKEENEK